MMAGVDKKSLKNRLAIRSIEKAVAKEMVTGAMNSDISSSMFIEFANYDDYDVGRFINLDSIHLKWVAPDEFTFTPEDQQPFGFERATGELISPDFMYTDGGSIPREIWWAQGLSPWGYAPAYLVHDWEFEAHHCGLHDKSFEAVRDTMMEGIKTLMESGLCPRSQQIFQAIFLGINSKVARRLWRREPTNCTLPERNS